MYVPSTPKPGERVICIDRRDGHMHPCVVIPSIEPQRADLVFVRELDASADFEPTCYVHREDVIRLN